ncbi:MAG: hypothetical protein HKL90_02085 [Elusimicrobia bacterium]|nr:hypothetical protein [Elusimicrobiota bacterium]
MTEEGRQALTAVVAEGLELCAKKISEATHDPWRVAELQLSVDEAGPFAAVFDSIVNDHYGTLLSFPGGSFLFLFSGKSGYLVTNSFTRDVQDRVEGFNQREARALGELANIVLNPLVGHVAKAWGFRLVVSAPQTRIASRRDHLMGALSAYAGGDGLAATFFARLTCDSLFSECHVLIFLERVVVETISQRRVKNA